MKETYYYQNPMTGEIVETFRGWSWPGFLFGIIWAAIKKMWSLVGIIFAIALLATMLGGPIQALANIAIAVFLGAKGNEEHEKMLINKGFKPFSYPKNNE